MVRAPAYAELQTTTNFSFLRGASHAEELAIAAEALGLTAVGITDRNSLAGIVRGWTAVKTRNIRVLSGCRLDFMDGTPSLLCYPTDREAFGRLTRLLTVGQRRAHKGECHLTWRDFLDHSDGQLGLIVPPKTLDEAFERFLKKNRPAWVPKQKISAPDAIKLIRAAGGLSVLAHPGLARSEEAIPALIEAGIDGIECFHTKHSASAAEYYVSVAEQHDLLITGGSDCHGMNKGKPLIGTIKLPYEYVRLLKQRLPEGHPARLAGPASP